MSIYLHYIGKRAYPDDTRFIDEARRKRACRACSFNILKHLVLEDSEIYYARYEEELDYCYARVFARGKVTGLSTTLDLSSVGINTGSLSWHREERGCGSYYACNCYVDDIREVITKIDKKAREDIEFRVKVESAKWFVLTDIEPFESIITHTLDYTKKEIIASPIAFSRGFILIGGKGEVGRKKHSKDVVMQVKGYKLYNKIVYNEKERERKVRNRLITNACTLDMFMG